MRKFDGRAVAGAAPDIAQDCYLTPVWVPFGRMTFSQMALRFTAAAGVTFRLGLYGSGGEGNPTGAKLLAQSDAISADIGVNTFVFPSPVIVRKGLAWAASEFSVGSDPGLLAALQMVRGPFDEVGDERMNGARYEISATGQNPIPPFLDPCPATVSDFGANFHILLRTDKVAG